MEIFTVRVGFADGDDFARRFAAVVRAAGPRCPAWADLAALAAWSACSDREAALVASQFVSATRCDLLHLQVISVSILGVLI